MPGTEPPAGTSAAATAAANNLRVDAMTATVVKALEAETIPCLLLKGPTFARWLYGSGETRTYGDCDLLVPDEAVERAGGILADLGFEPSLDETTMPTWWRAHAVEWLRPADGAAVDLHRMLLGVGASPERAWRTFYDRAETIVIAGHRTPMLDMPSRTLHVALHAAQHGPQGGRARRDLEQALARLDGATWREAAELASSLDATPAFAAGLRLTPAGQAMADELQLPSGGPDDVALRALSAPPLALGFDQLAQAEGFRERLAILRYKILPPPTFMRTWSARAREGHRGLAHAYVSRLLWLLRSAPTGLRAWRAARRR